MVTFRDNIPSNGVSDSSEDPVELSQWGPAVTESPGDPVGGGSGACVCVGGGGVVECVCVCGGRVVVCVCVLGSGSV